jgi:hypothetical protein
MPGQLLGFDDIAAVLLVDGVPPTSLRKVAVVV